MARRDDEVPPPLQEGVVVRLDERARALLLAIAAAGVSTATRGRNEPTLFDMADDALRLRALETYVQHVRVPQRFASRGMPDGDEYDGERFNDFMDWAEAHPLEAKQLKLRLLAWLLRPQPDA